MLQKEDDLSNIKLIDFGLCRVDTHAAEDDPDLRSMMGPNVNDSIRNLLDRFDPIDEDGTNGVSSGFSRQDSSRSNSNGIDNTAHGTGCGLFLTSGVECINPIPPEIRENASKMLIIKIETSLDILIQK